MLPRNREYLASQLPNFLLDIEDMVIKNQPPQYCDQCNFKNSFCPAYRMEVLVSLTTRKTSNPDRNVDVGVDELKTLPVLRSLAKVCIDGLKSGSDPLII